jgi:hypothetical protein
LHVRSILLQGLAQMGFCILLVWIDGCVFFFPPAPLNLDYGDSMSEGFKERRNGLMEFAHCQLPWAVEGATASQPRGLTSRRARLLVRGYIHLRGEIGREMGADSATCQS